MLVATLTLPRQDIDRVGAGRYGENLAFNPWHALAEHAPVGQRRGSPQSRLRGVARTCRRQANGVPATEPDGPRPLDVEARVRSPTARSCARAIHPAIGIARVGNSEEHYLIGPEVDRRRPREPGSFKDRTGALMRQAARFACTATTPPAR